MSDAQVKAGLSWEQLVAGWEAKLAGNTSDAEQRLQAAHEFAEARGFRGGRSEACSDFCKSGQRNSRTHSKRPCRASVFEHRNIETQR